MDEEETAFVGTDDVSVNYRPLLLIFFFILVCKLLRSVLTPLCSWTLLKATPLPGDLGKVKSELSQLKKEIATVSITDDFPTHSRLKRKQIAKEQELNVIEGKYRGTLLRKQALLEAVSTIFLEVVPVVVVIYWRSVPVVVLPEDCLWPLGGVVRFPTQVTGGVGSPIWALCSRQTLQALTSFFRKR